MSLSTIDVPVERLRVRSKDGTELAVYRCGSGPHRWLLPPGLGTPLLCWKYVFEAFHERMCIVTWDLRGCFDSAAPADLSRLTVADHADDALAVAEALGWLDGRGFMTGGWSLGIETGLEVYARVPQHVKALTLINGSYEHIFKSALGLPRADLLIGGLVKLAARAAPLFAPASAYLLGREWAAAFLSSIGIVAGNSAFFREVVKHFRRLDFATYFLLMLAVDAHSAKAILPTVRVPTLITAGSADKMTPLAISREMQAAILGSELFIVPGGTHYTTIEFPELVNLKLEPFFRQRVWPESWA